MGTPVWVLAARAPITPYRPSQAFHTVSPRCTRLGFLGVKLISNLCILSTVSLTFTEHRLPVSSTMRSACLSLLLVTACWALPFRQSGFLDFMLEDEGASGDKEVTT